VHAEVLRLGGTLPASVRLERLRTRGLDAQLTRHLDGVFPAAKLAVYGGNLDFFRSLDALVVAEKTSLILKSRYGLRSLRMIHTRHGAGDRAIGFNRASAKFDLVLASGPKVADRLVATAGVERSRIRIVGYPKFDIVPPPRPLPLQANGRPTVLYNPHVSPELSSWYAFGRQVLEFFRKRTDLNLIFAPHVMLFARPWVLNIEHGKIARPGRIDAAYLSAPNIFVDLGSPASTDMTYTNAADIYLGDVSSQVYEFLERPRPCIFLDPRRRDHASDPNFAHWRAGPVLTDASQLGAAIDTALTAPDRYRAAQTTLFDYTFDLTDEPSSSRAARAILELLQAGDAAAAREAELQCAG
jgi:hypothetical protein